MDSSPSFSSLHSQFAPSKSEVANFEDNPVNLTPSKKRTLTKNQADTLIAKKQRTSMDATNPTLITAEKLEVKAKIQQCFEEMGLLQVGERCKHLTIT